MESFNADMAIPPSCCVILPGDFHDQNTSSGCRSTSNERPRSNTFCNRYVSFSTGSWDGTVLCRNVVADIWPIPGETDTREN
jgi:hypothetical protein